MRIFLLGFYGYNNIGDEALLASILQSLDAPDFEFKVLSYHANQTTIEHRVAAISRGANFGLVNHIADCDAIVVGGGSILQDITSSKSLYYYVSLLMAAKALGKKAYLLGNGFGPIVKPINKRVLEVLIPKLDGIIARDADSFLAYQALGCKRVFNGVDCVFNLNTQRTSSHSQAPYIAIALRPWQDRQQTFTAIKQLIPDLNARGYAVKLIPMKAPDDADFMRGLTAVGQGAELVDNALAPVLATIADAKILIGMRLHALILAAISHTPMVAISYDPKIDSFMHQMGDRDVLNTQTVDHESLLSRVTIILDRYDETRERLADAVRDNRQRAAEQIAVFKQWLVGEHD